MLQMLANIGNKKQMGKYFANMRVERDVSRVQANTPDANETK